MKRYSDRFLRIAFFIERSTKLTREWFRGTMLYTRHNPKWFVRMFELGNGINEELLDFGTLRPDGIIACGVPARFLQNFFGERGMGDVPIMAFPQAPYPGVGTVNFDFQEIAAKAINLFKRRGCRHVVYVGAHLPNGIRISRAFAKEFAAEAEKAGLSYTIPKRKVYESIGIRVGECDEIMKQLAEYPKPCGILTYDDGIGRDLLDLCRLADINVPASVCVLGMGDNALICENANPSLSSIQLDYERVGFLAAKALDDMISGRAKEPPQLVCGMNGVTERGSTQNLRGGRSPRFACVRLYREKRLPERWHRPVGCRKASRRLGPDAPASLPGGCVCGQHPERNPACPARERLPDADDDETVDQGNHLRIRIRIPLPAEGDFREEVRHEHAGLP